ncbi:MAG: antitoxin Xre/MbcA/ParS toxin-binding domain-containing protein [Acidithiobacillus sp.]
MAECISTGQLLGGREVLPILPENSLQWVEVIRHGISSAALVSLSTTLHLSLAELAAVLGIPYRTLVRRKRETMLNSEESAKVIRLARIIERAEDVFDSLDKAIDWLKTRNASLSGLTPLSLVDTDVGAETVLDTLGRIEHGVFA